MIDTALFRNYVAWLKNVMSNVQDSKTLDESLAILTEEAAKDCPDLKRASRACRAIHKSEDELDMQYHFQSLATVEYAMRAVAEYHLMRGVHDTLACVGGPRGNEDLRVFPSMILDLMDKYPMKDVQSAKEWCEFIETLDGISQDLKFIVKYRARPLHDRHFDRS